LERLIAIPAHLGLAGGLVASDGNVFLASLLGGQVTELNAATGAVERVIPGTAGTNDVTALATSGPYLLVGSLNASGGAGQGAVTEVDPASGRVVETISGKQYHLGIPVAMAIAGGDLFVLSLTESNSGNNIWALSEVNLGDGQLVRVFPNAVDGISNPSTVYTYGPYVYVASLGRYRANANLTGSYGPGAVSQIDASSGALVRVIRGTRFDLDSPSALAGHGGRVYVADTGANAITVLDAGTGALVGVLSGKAFNFDAPDGLAVYGGHLYVANYDSQSVTDVQIGA
jgi:outer membrane protein assembly factor BamB